MVILGIETSCDETSAAVTEEKNGCFSVLANIVSSQVKLHAAWGGVVPNLAAREHLKNIIPVIKEALEKSKRSEKDIDLISVTRGPGLIPALLIGTTTARTISYLWKKPLAGIDHIEGHIYANFINTKYETRNTKQNTGIKFPILCLVVSGGHTQLVFMRKHLEYEIIGETLDDAAGEAFDKVARILGLGYPGGPEISKIAAAYKLQAKNYQLAFPRPMLKSDNFNFSFSGLKTAVLYETKKHPDLLKDKEYVAAVCHEFQQAVIDVLVAKTLRAAKKYNPQTILLAGGVSANAELRKQLEIAVKNELPDTKYQIPNTKYSLDNAAMIAVAGYWRYALSKDKKAFLKNWKKLNTDANLKLT